MIYIFTLYRLIWDAGPVFGATGRSLVLVIEPESLTMGHTEPATIMIYRLCHLCVRIPVVQSFSVNHQSESAILTHLITRHYMLHTTTSQQNIGNLTAIHVLSAYLTSASAWHRGKNQVFAFLRTPSN